VTRPPRGDAEPAAESQQASVDQSVQDHARRVDRVGVGDAASLHHARRDSELCRQLVELRTATVHEHDAYAEVMQYGDLLDEGAHRGRVAKRAAARLDDEDLALVHVYVRRGAPERPHGDGLFSLVCNHRPNYPLSSL